jgi:hypothetical protein
MELELLRLDSQEDLTFGALFVNEPKKYLCATLEDEHREVKVWGETRIPAGRYLLSLRDVGPLHERYKERFGEAHRGMLWLRDVPGFEYICIHIGNDEDDTGGCPLVGYGVDRVGGRLTDSLLAYSAIYGPIADAIESKEAWITITDYDDPK